MDHARDSFGTYQRTQERAVAYTVLAHKNVLTRFARLSVPRSVRPRPRRARRGVLLSPPCTIVRRAWQGQPGGEAL